MEWIGGSAVANAMSGPEWAANGLIGIESESLIQLDTSGIAIEGINRVWTPLVAQVRVQNFTELPTKA